MQLIATSFSLLMIVVGAILFPLPVPFGIFFIIGGISMLRVVNPPLARRFYAFFASWLGKEKMQGAGPLGDDGDPKADQPKAVNEV